MFGSRRLCAGPANVGAACFFCTLFSCLIYSWKINGRSSSGFCTGCSCSNLATHTHTHTLSFICSNVVRHLQVSSNTVTCLTATVCGRIVNLMKRCTSLALSFPLYQYYHLSAATNCIFFMHAVKYKDFAPCFALTRLLAICRSAFVWIVASLSHSTFIESQRFLSRSSKIHVLSAWT